MITARKLSKRYGEIKAVSEVDFEIARGECVGLLGLNGAGKTTLLRMMACLLVPTAGSISIDEIQTAQASVAVRKRIGFLPEVPPLYEEMTVREYLTFAGRLRRLPKVEIPGAIDFVARTCELANVLTRRIETLSWGYKKRVGIAQAIVHRPDLVVLDEPIAGLDPAQIIGMRELIRSLAHDHTVVLSSHILSEISQTCDRILMIHNGRLVASGSEQELKRSLGSGLVVDITVRGEEETVNKVFARFKEIKRADCVHKEGVRMGFCLELTRDIRVELSRALVEAGLGLEEISRVQDQLETAFLRLTGKEGQA